MADAAFVSCGGAGAPQGRRREVVAEALGVLVFIHPQGTAELERTGRLGGNGLLTNIIGNPLETTIALSHLIFEGTPRPLPRAQDLRRPRWRLRAVGPHPGHAGVE